jgi:hypothetical protein
VLLRAVLLRLRSQQRLHLRQKQGGSSSNRQQAELGAALRGTSVN